MNSSKTYKTAPAAFASIETEALRLATEGAARISVKKLIEDVRARERIEVNNSDSTEIADWLCQRHPHLEKLIERRARGARGPNKAKPANDHTSHEDIAFLGKLLAGRKIRIKAVTFAFDGVEKTADLDLLRDLVKESA
jgi:hypothetical protein